MLFPATNVSLSVVLSAFKDVEPTCIVEKVLLDVPVPVELIVISLLVLSVVMVTPEPATKLNVSERLLAVTVFCPDTLKPPNPYCCVVGVVHDKLPYPSVVNT